MHTVLVSKLILRGIQALEDCWLVVNEVIETS